MSDPDDASTSGPEGEGAPGGDETPSPLDLLGWYSAGPTPAAAEHPSGEGFSLASALTAASGPAARSPAALHPPPGPSSGSSRRVRPLMAAAGVAALAAVAAVVVVVQEGGAQNAGAAVAQAVNSTLSDKTAAVTWHAHMTANGQSLDFGGSGSADFTRDAMQMNLTVPGESGRIEAVYLGGTLYENIPEISQFAPGKTWISIDLASTARSLGTGSSGSLGAEGNPAAMLRLLAQQGNTVVALGSSTVDGTSVQGYSVTISAARLRSELANPDLPGWMRQALTDVTVADAHFGVFVGPHNLLRRQTTSVRETVHGTAVSVVYTLDLSGYGTPVSIVAPPPDQVLGFEQFLRQAQGALEG
jgi:hypothetical protein